MTVTIKGAVETYKHLPASPSANDAYRVLNPCIDNSVTYTAGVYVYVSSAWLKCPALISESLYTKVWSGPTTAKSYIPAVLDPHRTFYLDTTTGILSVYNGSTWTEIE